MNKKRLFFCIAIVLLIFVAVEMAFALDSQPRVSFRRGDTIIILTNTNPKKSGTEGYMKDIWLCIDYRDAEGTIRPYTDGPFEIPAASSINIPAKGPLMGVDVERCSVLNR